MNLDVPLIDILPKLSMAASSSAAPQPNIGILSIGDMGMGVASLLKAHDYMVYTVGAGRRYNTSCSAQTSSTELTKASRHSTASRKPR